MVFVCVTGQESCGRLTNLWVRDDGRLCPAAIYRGNDALDDFR